MTDSVRVDKWLWAARFFKTRALAREAIAGGKVELNGHRVKPGKAIKMGDCLAVKRGDDLYEITVADLSDRRVSAELAQQKYSEEPASRQRREAAAELRKQHRALQPETAHRPDKRERRKILEFIRRRG